MLPKTKDDREFQKFVEDINGNVSIRVEASMVQGDATKIQGVDVNNTAPEDQQLLVYHSDVDQWKPTDVATNNTDKVFYSSLVSTVALTLKRITGQISKIFSVKNESDTEVMAIDNDGTLMVRDSSSISDLSIQRYGYSDHGISLYGTPANKAMRFSSDSYVIDISKNGMTFYSGTTYFLPNGGAFATAPSYSWRGDSNTGMYNPSADTIGFTTGGVVKQLINTTNATYSIPVVFPSYATASLPDASLHEGGIVYDATVDRIKYSNGTKWKSDELEKGWIQVQDTTYTSGSPQSFSNGVRKILAINDDAVIDTYSPTGDSSWWDGVNYIFQPAVSGAYYEIRINLTFGSFTADRDAVIELDIGGSIGTVYSKNIRLSKASLTQNESIVVPVYCLSTFIANGGKFYLTAVGTSLTVYDITMVIFKQWNP